VSQARRGLFAAVAAATTAFTTAVAIAAAATAITAVTAAATAPAAIAAATAASATATTITAATTATAAEAAATGGTFFAGTRDVDRQGPALDFMSMELLNRLLGLFRAGQGNEGEAAGTTGEFVEDDLNDADGSNLAEQGLEVLGGAGEGKIPHVELVVF